MYENIDAYIDSLLKGSTPDKPLWNIESIRQGKPAHWNYIDGCMMTALLNFAEITGDKKYSDFVCDFIDYYVGDDGSILGYSKDKYNLDDINEGRVLFDLYDMTGKEKYLKAIERLHAQIVEQPRTNTGNFWHKQIYPNQIWLDGIYMAQVFYVRYQLKNGGDISDTLSQIKNVRKYMFSEEKGLCYHGMDCSKSAFWADKQTGLSKNFWLRAIGWFTVALADIIAYTDGSDREEFISVFRDVIKGISQYADPETGMYYQVVDCGGREGNYLETSGSSMIAYAMLKGARLGVIDESYAALGRKTFDGICKKYLTVSENGELHLGGICLVAGLGPEDNKRRDGSYEYYISEPVVENDAKGVAPFLLCYTEVLRTQKN
ncbi:MAG: glycoside hydrolase family 88 protein [Ruminococcus sp.]|uniref:glycoside hydrolase family 88/105 protein n=1 Tax=Ruminococcus sp. TaxID=41978 RepID=UPI0025E8FAA4|nr:glycoside hydrolase family 88 protein [Ruminococcus sp.]MBQ9541814.1 glycoside hydrolase family 88 protein [Ruminococcus sp.]MBR0529825.1 glycoside hydrolase family 88 protein [Ruminococcus sp.]